MRTLVLTVALVLSGCGGSAERVPGQDQAESIVWRGLFGELGPAPPVEWFHETAVSAFGNTGSTLPGWKVQVSIWATTCPAGLYSVEAFDCSLSGSSYAHELMHAHEYNRTGDVDAAHRRGDWRLADDVAFQALIDARL